MADPLPKSEQPKVVATVVAGNLAAFGVWVWNQFQLVEKCTPLGDVCEMVASRWTLIDPWDAFMVANIAWMIGPLLRWYERRMGGQPNELAVLQQDMKTLAQAVQKLQQKEPDA